MSTRMPVRGALALRRGLASVSSFETTYTKTKTTSLPNGLTVATETIPSATTATVGLWIDAGTRAENEYTNGSANFFEHLAFKGNQIENAIESIGGQIDSTLGRENSAFFAKSFKEDIPKTVEILAGALSPKVDETAVDAVRESILVQASDASKSYKQIVLDHLHAIAFQAQPLGFTATGPAENIEAITTTEVSNYIKKNFKADRIVLVGAGAVEHEELVSLAQKHLGGLESSATSVAPGTGSRHPSDVTSFVGSEVRLRDDTIPGAYIAIAVEGVPSTSPDYYASLVASTIIGNYDIATGTAANQGNKLSTIVHDNHLGDSFTSFSSSYSDSGLWGVYLVSHNILNLDDLVHFTLKEWNRLSVSVTPSEVERAKAQLKTSLLLALDGPTAVAKDIGTQIVSTGRRQSPEEIERTIDAITEKDVKAFAQKYLWDKDIVISALGSIEGLLDYQRLRNDMSMMRW